ncbi:MAG: sigma-70 family RNA polymerase sigma factor [Candidatus Nealsonbacteria bacterium]|nr:sigma-70 family RNA polymerase sigma factor [Candidatus Nealsonbacteria bacterium]
MSQLQKQFGEIYDKYIEKIYRFVFLKVNSQEIAEDLTSEVFTRGWESFKKNKCDIKNLQAFLYQIARNLVVDHYRQKGQAQLVSTDALPLIDSSMGLEEKSMLKSDVNNVKAALANLNDDYREIIIWYYLDELSAPEIAKILGKSEEAVRVQIHRAINALRGVIK